MKIAKNFIIWFLNNPDEFSKKIAFILINHFNDYFSDIKTEKIEFEFNTYASFSLYLGKTKWSGGSNGNNDFVSFSIGSSPENIISYLLGSIIDNPQLASDFRFRERVIKKCFPSWSEKIIMHEDAYNIKIDFPEQWKKTTDTWPDFFSKYKNLKKEGSNLDKLFAMVHEYYEYVDKMYRECLPVIEKFLISEGKTKYSDKDLMVIKAEIKRMKV